MQYLLTVLSDWRSKMDTALQAKDEATFDLSMRMVGRLVVCFVATGAGVGYLGGTLRINWREHLAGEMLREYFGYALYGLKGTKVDNPDERVTSAVERLCDSVVGMVIVAVCAGIALVLVYMNHQAKEREPHRAL